MRRTHLALAALALLPTLVTGCRTGDLDGEVDGQSVPNFLSSAFIDAGELTAEDDEFLIASFFTFPNAERAVAEQYQAKAEAIESLLERDDVEDTIDDLAEEESDLLPEEYWALHVTLQAENRGDLVDGFEIGEDAIEVVLCHHNGATFVRAENIFAALAPDFMAFDIKDENRDCFVATEGDLEVESFEDGVLSFDGELELSDVDLDDVGDVTVSGVASEDRGMTIAFDDLLEKLVTLDQALGG